MKTRYGNVEYAVNVNCLTQPFIEEILERLKLVETRTCYSNNIDKGSLDRFIGQRVGLVETGKGKPMLVGFVDIVGRYVYDTEDEFDNHYYLHRVLPGTQYAFQGRRKYGYILENPERLDCPIMMDRVGRVFTKI